jgi:hypothetical protein
MKEEEKNMYSNRNTINSVLALTMLVAVTLACGSSSATSQPAVISTATSESSATAPTNAGSAEVPTETTVPDLYLGDAVQESGYALTAVTVADPAKPGIFYTAESGKKLIAVEVDISNISGDMLSVNPLYATLLDSEGFVYQPELLGVDDQLSTYDLNPGEQVRGWIAFKVPEKAIAGSIKYSTALFGNSFLKASLTAPPAGHQPIAASLTPNIPASKLGDVVSQYGYSLTATAVDDPAKPGMLYKPKKGYKLVAVEVVLSNDSGTDVLSVNPLYGYLVDSNGFVYGAELAGVDNQISASDLSSGEKTKGWISFVIPDGSSPAYIKYQLGALSGNYLVTGLNK